MTDVPKRANFETAYAGQAPWDIGRPQQAFLNVADREARVRDQPPPSLLKVTPEAQTAMYCVKPASALVMTQYVLRVEGFWQSIWARAQGVLTMLGLFRRIGKLI